MERKSQSAYSRLVQRLAPNIYDFNFYRFCQLLESIQNGRPPLGSTISPSDDPIRFRPHPGMGFPASELRNAEWDEVQPEQLPTIRTLFLGLYGVDSPLPTAYLDDIAQRREGYEGVTDFLDIFNHRMMTQYYRIWRKYSYPATYHPGGKDDTSQCLLGLVGLGIPGSQQQIATPVSRFLALLGTMRLPTRTAEGVIKLVALLAPQTQTRVTAHDRRRVWLIQPARLSRHYPIQLSQRLVLGKTGTDVNSQMVLHLYTEDADEAQGWLPQRELHTDLLVLLRVYLGWRCSVRLHLTLPKGILPPAQLGKQRVRLGRTGVLGLKPGTQAVSGMVTINLGNYQGLLPSYQYREVENGSYQF
ncbi:type VI secretion system baseplate subunit TssG [Photorhabdus heterorhabditis]|uniref:Type VI secretion protein n=1 Tax=Photorhabdus heterorhabditis TaxID=880156 RepID=A0A5B0W890_9GAMM|nr:type VI secretion system baseplate subunit TssG [Photorhabdus heterorhabditis]KAA1183154.1 type VI secretion system baseplate subunit TssG [Photorhabdus heterorhabditis]KOY60525.1 type VI secretion protein [Photorhabdus heterorhabditis]